MKSTLSRFDMPLMGEISSPKCVTATLERGSDRLFSDLAPQWTRLCEEVNAAPFCRPEWIAAHVRAFEPTSEVTLVSAKAGGRLVGVLPLIRKRCFYAGIPLMKLVGTANSHSIQFDILRAAGEMGNAAIRAMWKLLRQTDGWHALELPLFSPTGGCPALLALAAADNYPTVQLLVQNSPTLRLLKSGSGEPAQAIGSRHFRHELRRFARVLTQELGAEPTIHRRDYFDPVALRRFFDLEEAGWKGQKGSAINCRRETRTYYASLARSAAERGYFRMHSLEANGKMIAGAFSVATENQFFPMKVAYDETLRRGGPGHLLINAMVTECLEHDIPELFFGGTDERYKSLWTHDTVPLSSAFVLSSDIRSRIAYQVRSRLLSPLGKLRWSVRERLRANNDTKRSKPGAPEARPAKAELPKKIRGVEVEGPGPVVHS